MTETEERELDEAIQVKLFLRDNRHLFFEETPENFDALRNRSSAFRAVR